MTNQIRKLVTVLGGACLVLALAIFAVFMKFGSINPPPISRGGDIAKLLEQPGRIIVPVGFSFSVFAEGLGQPRLMQQTPQGDIIVSGYRDGTILLVKPDAAGTGRSDGTITLAKDLNDPHGLVLEGESLYVAERHQVTRYSFNGTTLSEPKIILEGLPDDSGHDSRTLKRGPDGYFYLSTGSSCNSCIEDHPLRATIIRFREAEAPVVFAKGLRNTVGFDWHLQTGRLYGVENSRDNLGDDVPDDELNEIIEGRHYGWPFVHGSGVADPELAALAPEGQVFETPKFGFGAHHAPLAIKFLRHQSDGQRAVTALVSEHGSWNRSSRVSYRVMRQSFEGKQEISVFMEGCVQNEEVFCRPVDIIESALKISCGTIYISDDFTGAIYRIAPHTKSPNSC